MSAAASRRSGAVKQGSPDELPAAAASDAVAEFAPGTPLVFAVGSLGPSGYWQWVHRPSPGQPRFFASDLAERLTKVDWWVVPLLWLPLWAAASAASLALLGTPPAELVPLQLVGLVLWQALEYTIHRWVFHAALKSYWGITFHFLFHGCHHKFPMDAQRLVFPPVPAAAIAGGIFCGLRLVCSLGAAAALMEGVILGYVFYDCLHYAIHHGWRLPGPLLQELRVRHSHHHYHDHDHSFGISSVFFDVLLRTSARLP